jgi:uncharacterized protein
MSKQVSQELLAILRCPACEDRPQVELQQDSLVCVKCSAAYPIRDSVPIMLVEEAVRKEAGR